MLPLLMVVRWGKKTARGEARSKKKKKKKKFLLLRCNRKRSQSPAFGSEHPKWKWPPPAFVASTHNRSRIAAVAAAEAVPLRGAAATVMKQRHLSVVAALCSEEGKSSVVIMNEDS